MRFIVGPASDLPPGAATIVYPERVRSGIGIFNIDGEFFALKNTCPHMGGPLCRGRVRGTSAPRLPAGELPELEWTRGGEIVSCPWHHWEFEIRTGRTVFPSRDRVRSYRVELATAEELARLREGAETYDVLVEDETIVVEV
jgi:nitrite reductase (NADH) small subunit